MIVILPKCLLYGTSFSPLAVEKSTNIVFSQKNEPGDIGNIGRYKDKTIPYGSATLQPSDKQLKESGAVNILLEMVRENIYIFIDKGAVDITLELVVFHDGQCNIEFSIRELFKIAELNLPLSISTYECPEVVKDGYISNEVPQTKCQRNR